MRTPVGQGEETSAISRVVRLRYFLAGSLIAYAAAGLALYGVGRQIDRAIASIRF